MAQQRRRPMSREEALAGRRAGQGSRKRSRRAGNWPEAPFDLPFLVLVVLLSGIGLVMLLSASFPSAYYETEGANRFFTLSVRAFLPSWALRPCC